MARLLLKLLKSPGMGFFSMNDTGTIWNIISRHTQEGRVALKNGPLTCFTLLKNPAQADPSSFSVDLSYQPTNTLRTKMQIREKLEEE
jgi:hypothetical protein